MPVKVEENVYDTVKEACARLKISRNTLLSYIREGIVDEPPTVKRGKTKYRYFPESWYQLNEPKVRAA